MKKTVLINMGAALAMGVASFAVAAPAQARHHYDRGDYYRGDGYNRGYNGYRGNGYYRGDGYYRGNRAYYGDRRSSYRCRRGDGTTGTILGAIAGGLLGRSVDRYGDRAPGTIIGAGAGALVGRSLDRNNC